MLLLLLLLGLHRQHCCRQAQSRKTHVLHCCMKKAETLQLHANQQQQQQNYRLRSCRVQAPWTPLRCCWKAQHPALLLLLLHLMLAVRVPQEHILPTSSQPHPSAAVLLLLDHQLSRQG
jgi:hypothetical protein